MTELLKKLANILVGTKDATIDFIDFQTAGELVQGAQVIETEFFCNEWNFKVAYLFTGKDEQEHTMTQWVAMSELLAVV